MSLNICCLVANTFVGNSALCLVEFCGYSRNEVKGGKYVEQKRFIVGNIGYQRVNRIVMLHKKVLQAFSLHFTLFCHFDVLLVWDWGLDFFHYC